MSGSRSTPTLDRYITTSFGPSSPSGPEDVAALSDDDLIHLLATWQPPAEDMRPSREGLGRVLSQLAAAEPSRFSRLAVRFRGCDPTYVRALLDGLWRAAQPGGSGSSITQSMDWAAVLTLGHWICEQATGLLPRHGFGGDPHWGWAKRALVSLVLRGLSDGSQQFSILLEPRCESLLQVLLDDPDPTLAEGDGTWRECSRLRPQHGPRSGGSSTHPVRALAVAPRSRMLSRGPGVAIAAALPNVRAALGLPLGCCHRGVARRRLGVRAEGSPNY